MLLATSAALLVHKLLRPHFVLRSLNTWSAKSLHNKISTWLHLRATQWKLFSMAHLTAPDSVLKLQLKYKNAVVLQTFVCSLCYSQAAVLEKQSPQTVNHPRGTKSNGNNATWKFVYMALFPLWGISVSTKVIIVACTLFLSYRTDFSCYSSALFVKTSLCSYPCKLPIKYPKSVQ